jgi:serine/threonine-protein kinase RIO1
MGGERNEKFEKVRKMHRLMEVAFNCRVVVARLRLAGIPCPEPIELRMHVLLMSFIGDSNGWYKNASILYHFLSCCVV